jgi:hypothetical protein
MLAKRYVQELSKTMTDADKIQWVQENLPNVLGYDPSPTEVENVLQKFDKLIENKSLSELRYAQEMEGVYGANNKRSDLLRKAEAGIQKEYLEKLQEAGLTEDIDDYLESVIQRNRPLFEIIEGEKGKPPPAPFVTKTEGWNKLAVKRIMNKAAKEGYDMVAFSSGDIQFDRWRNQGLKQEYDEILPGIIKTVAGKKPNLRIEVGEGSELYEVPAIRLDDKVGKQTVRERSLSPQTMFSTGAGITALGAASLLAPDQAEASGLGVKSRRMPDDVAFKAAPKKESPGIASLAGQLGLGALSEIGGAILGGAAGVGEYLRGSRSPIPATAQSIRDTNEGVSDFVGGLYDAGPEAQVVGQEIMQGIGETIAPIAEYAMEGPIMDERGLNMLPLIAQKLGIPAYQLAEMLFNKLPEREQEAAISASDAFL